jgi:peptidyl-tRNA hydrolase, PTH1 family
MRKRKLFRFNKLGRKSAKNLKSDYYVFGLGNIGIKYANTRHNAGFDVLDIVAQKNEADFDIHAHKGACARFNLNSKSILLIKPQTFMNNSGHCVLSFVKKYNIDLDKIIVIYDDIDLNKSALRIRSGGSAGTHNGLRSIIYHLQRDDFMRIRIGIGRPDDERDLIPFVIGHYPNEDLDLMFDCYSKAGLAALETVKNGITSAQQKFNSKGI